jgi:universal stress protein A
MNAFQHVLVGLDLNGVNAPAILARACQIADSDDIEVIHVCDQHPRRHDGHGVSGFANSDALDQRVVAEADSRLDDMCRGYGISDHKVLGGKPARVMHEYARRHADLVVVGSHGRRGMQTLLGSTSNAVVHGTPCDVLAVHVTDDPDQQPAAYGHILVAVNLAEESSRVMQHALRIAAASKAAVCMCHVFTGFDRKSQARERRDLQALGSKFGIDPEVQHSISGATANGIRDLATRIDVDLIVVGTHGKRGLELLKGSTANAVLHGAQCDALTVRVA